MIRATVQRQTVNVRALLDGLLADFASRMAARRVTFEALTFADELSADPSLLRQLLVRLIEHALRRAPDGTRVTLVVSPRPGYVQFQLADEGPRLGPFTRQKVSGPDATSVQGRGFALMDCVLLTEAHGGSLWIPPTATGTIVCVALPTPAAPRDAGFARKKSGTYLRASQLGPAAKAQTILVVDDEPLVRTFVSRALKDRGFGVIEADCAERAMDRVRVRQQPLALLLTDVGLPDVSGADLARQAKLLNPSIPTLLMSATPKKALVQQGVIREGTYLLEKPFSIADLFAALERALLQPASSFARVSAS